MTTEQDEHRLAEICNDYAAGRIIVAVRDFECLLRLLAAANERIARLEVVAKAAERYRDGATGELSTLNALWDALDALSPAGAPSK